MNEKSESDQTTGRQDTSGETAAQRFRQEVFTNSTTMSWEGRLNTQEFSTAAIELFGTIDIDSNGFLSDQELAGALEKEYTGQRAQAVAGLFGARETLGSLHDDEILRDNDGITLADLEAFEQRANRDETVRGYIDGVSQWLKDADKIKEIDINRDGILSLEEIESARADKNSTGDDRAKLNFLQINYRALARDSDADGQENGISGEDLLQSPDRAVREVEEIVDRTNLVQQVGTRQLYRRGNPETSIISDAISQGDSANNQFLSALGSLAAADPEQIYKMIQDNQDGTYTVTFPGDRDNPVTVEAPTEAELGTYNQGAEYGVWANVLEKAYGKYCRENSFGSLFNLSGGDSTVESGNGSNITDSATLSLLTGKESDTDFLLFSSEEDLAKNLTTALTGRDREPVTASIRELLLTDSTEAGLEDGRSYSVVAYDPEGGQGGTLTVRDTDGNTSNYPGGYFQLSLTEFMDNFTTITFSNN